MATTLLTLLILVGVFVGLPVLAYMIMKFGRTGFLRAGKQPQQKENNEVTK
jgi:hypothetical protein